MLCLDPARLDQEALHHALVSVGTCPACGRSLDVSGLCHGPECRDDTGRDLGCACAGCGRARRERLLEAGR